MEYFICDDTSKLTNEVKKNSDLADELLYGTEVEILDEVKHKYKIKTFYNYEGFVNKPSLTKLPYGYKKENITLTTLPATIVTKEPNIRSRQIGLLYCGSKIKARQYDEFYYEIEYKNNRAYIRKQELIKSASPKILLNNKQVKEEVLRKNLIKTAKKYLNAPYKWGGKTHCGIDCSGLIFMTCYLNNIIVYRDSKIKKGFAVKKINKEALKPADLVYYKGHISMYLGDNRIIHSSFKNGKVKIDSFDILEPINYGSIFSL